MKNKKRERKAEIGLVITHTQKKAVAVLPDCVFIPCYFPFSPLSLSFLSCYVTSVAGSVPLGVPALVIQPARSFTPIAAEASLQTLLVITDCACTNVKVVPFPTAAPHSKKKKGAQHFQAKTRYQRARVEKAVFFCFSKKGDESAAPPIHFRFYCCYCSFINDVILLFFFSFQISSNVRTYVNCSLHPYKEVNEEEEEERVR